MRSAPAPAILQAVIAANDGAPAYGADAFTARARNLARRSLRARRATSFLVSTGTAANALALAALAPPWGAIFCHEEAHIHDDECGAPELFTGGAKLVGIPGEGGKIAPAALRETLARFPARARQSRCSPARCRCRRRPRPARSIRRPRSPSSPRSRMRPGSPCIWTGRVSPMRWSRSAATPAADELAGGRRRPFVRRHQERRACLRGGDLLRRQARGEFCLPAQARRPHPVEGPLSRRADGGLSRRRPVADAGPARERRGGAHGGRPRQGSRRSPRLAPGRQRSVPDPAADGRRRAARRRRRVPRVELARRRRVRSPRATARRSYGWSAPTPRPTPRWIASCRSPPRPRKSRASLDKLRGWPSSYGRRNCR